MKQSTLLGFFKEDGKTKPIHAPTGKTAVAHATRSGPKPMHPSEIVLPPMEKPTPRVNKELEELRSKISRRDPRYSVEESSYTMGNYDIVLDAGGYSSVAASDLTKEEVEKWIARRWGSSG